MPMFRRLALFLAAMVPLAAAAAGAVVTTPQVRAELVAGTYGDAQKSALTLAGLLAVAGEARLAVESFAALLK